MNPAKPSNLWLLLVTALLFRSSSLQADGGTVRLSERQGAYQVTVFTAPTPFRAGPVDVSVLVQDATTGEMIQAARVTIRATPKGQPGDTIQTLATTEAATNKLFHAALFELPAPGWWEVVVFVEGSQGSTQVRFEVEAAGPQPPWLSLWPWVGWPALVILVFGIHQLLVRRRRPSAEA